VTWWTSSSSAARCVWARALHLSEGSLAREIYDGAERISERHRHRYEFNPAFREKLEQGGLVFSGVSPDKKFIEIIELSRDDHAWFLACPVSPEFKSKPLFSASAVRFIRARSFSNRLHTEAAIEQVTERKRPPLWSA